MVLLLPVELNGTSWAVPSLWTELIPYHSLLVYPGIEDDELPLDLLLANMIGVCEAACAEELLCIVMVKVMFPPAVLVILSE